MAKYPKKPKAPKASATLRTWENYEHRLKEWEKTCRDIDSAIKRKESIIGRTRKGTSHHRHKR